MLKCEVRKDGAVELTCISTEDVRKDSTKDFDTDGWSTWTNFGWYRVSTMETGEYSTSFTLAHLGKCLEFLLGIGDYDQWRVNLVLCSFLPWTAGLTDSSESIRDSFRRFERVIIRSLHSPGTEWHFLLMDIQWVGVLITKQEILLLEELQSQMLFSWISPLEIESNAPLWILGAFWFANHIS